MSWCFAWDGCKVISLAHELVALDVLVGNDRILKVEEADLEALYITSDYVVTIKMQRTPSIFAVTAPVMAPSNLLHSPFVGSP